MSEPLRALVVEDFEDDAELMIEELRDGGYEPAWTRVDRPEAFRAALERQDWDVILSDFSMPHFSAPAALQIAKESGKDIPFIIVSGTMGETAAVQAMRAGARDFFAKAHIERLSVAVAREVREARIRRERAYAERRFQEMQERYRLVVENVKEYAIFMLDSAALVASWNAGAERLTGYAEPDVVGRHLAILFPEEERLAADAYVERALAEGAHRAVTLQVRKDGSRFWAEVSTTPIRRNDRLIGFSHVIHDVTERKNLIDGLRQAVRARDEFLSIASHELQTPLTALRVQLESYERAALGRSDARAAEPRLSEKMRAIGRHAERLSVLVENLLDVTRIASGNVVGSRSTVDLRDVVDAVVHRFRTAIDRSGSQLLVDVQGPATGSWDRERIETAIANLLSNALRFGEGKPVRFVIGRREDRATVSVIDHGAGIPKEAQQRIFERFERAVPTTHYGGFGLGLWVARAIVEAHGGTVRVESRPGQGSTFQIELPTDVGRDQARAPGDRADDSK